MRQCRALGSLQVSPLTLGGNVFGWTADEAQSFAVLDAYVAGGGNLIDTADSYSIWVPENEGGESETIIGRWLAARAGRRDQVLIATKVGAHPSYRGLSPRNIKAAAEQSLRRLGTDHVDLYYTHFDDESVPVEEIVTALDELVREGKVREIGASNLAPERLAASLAHQERSGAARYRALQTRYSLVERDGYEGDLAEVVSRHGLLTLPYHGLASGFLTGKYRPEAGQIDSPRAVKAARYLESERGPRVLAALDQIAAARGAEPATVALAWLAAQPTVAAPLASARTVEQLPALLAVAELELTEEEVAVLTAASD